MRTIPSFTINHLNLLPGVYVSRKDVINDTTITTFDIRITAPYRFPVMDTGAIHALEHLGATFLRNDREWGDKIIYFGPMGCRTGFYLILAGELVPLDIISLLRDMFTFVIEFIGEIPGATAATCGNYKDMNLLKAKEYSVMFYNDVLLNIDESRMRYRNN